MWSCSSREPWIYVFMLTRWVQVLFNESEWEWSREDGAWWGRKCPSLRVTGNDVFMCHIAEEGICQCGKLLTGSLARGKIHISALRSASQQHLSHAHRFSPFVYMFTFLFVSYGFLPAEMLNIIISLLIPRASTWNLKFTSHRCHDSSDYIVSLIGPLVLFAPWLPEWTPGTDSSVIRSCFCMLHGSR